jgi:hypothetical protein
VLAAVATAFATTSTGTVGKNGLNAFAKRKIFLRAIGTIDHKTLRAFEGGVLAKRQRRHTHPFFRRRAGVAVQQVQQNKFAFAVDRGVTVQRVAQRFGVIPGRGKKKISL